MTRVDIAKLDEEKRTVFGWASVISKNGQVVVDRQGDFIDKAEELEETAYRYVLHSRTGGDMHIRKGVATIVESIVFTPEKLEKLGLPANSLPVGWWIGMKVHDDHVWGEIKKGTYTGFSIGGRGVRNKVQVGAGYTELGKNQPTSSDVAMSPSEKKSKKHKKDCNCPLCKAEGMSKLAEAVMKAGFKDSQRRDKNGMWTDGGAPKKRGRANIDMNTGGSFDDIENMSREDRYQRFHERSKLAEERGRTAVDMESSAGSRGVGPKRLRARGEFRVQGEIGAIIDMSGKPVGLALWKHAGGWSIVPMDDEGTIDHRADPLGTYRTKVEALKAAGSRM